MTLKTFFSWAEQQGWSQARIAEACGVSEATVSRWKADLTSPDAGSAGRVALAITAATGKPTSELEVLYPERFETT